MSTTVTGGVKTFSDRANKTTEDNEPLNVRLPDDLDAFIQLYLGVSPTGFFTDKQFVISDPAVTSRPEYVVFDRYYPTLQLLVDFRPTAYKYEVQRDETNREVASKRKYAQEHGFKYLPIFDGRVTADDMQDAGFSRK